MPSAATIPIYDKQLYDANFRSDVRVAYPNAKEIGTILFGRSLFLSRS